MSDGSGTAATVARLFYSCCGGDADDYQAAEERRRRSAFTSRFKTLLTGLQVQLGAKPKGLHPRDQIFDCILHLYAHEVRVRILMDGTCVHKVDSLRAGPTE